MRGEREARLRGLFDIVNLGAAYRTFLPGASRLLITPGACTSRRAKPMAFPVSV